LEEYEAAILYENVEELECREGFVDENRKDRKRDRGPRLGGRRRQGQGLLVNGRIADRDMMIVMMMSKIVSGERSSRRKYEPPRKRLLYKMEERRGRRYLRSTPYDGRSSIFWCQILGSDVIEVPLAPVADPCPLRLSLLRTP
jgi:hypothetical protein